MRKRDFAVPGSLPKSLQQPGGQAKTSSQELHLLWVFYMGSRDPSTWVIIYYLVRHIGRKLGPVLAFWYKAVPNAVLQCRLVQLRFYSVNTFSVLSVCQAGALAKNSNRVITTVTFLECSVKTSIINLLNVEVLEETPLKKKAISYHTADPIPLLKLSKFHPQNTNSLISELFC